MFTKSNVIKFTIITIVMFIFFGISLVLSLLLHNALTMTEVVYNTDYIRVVVKGENLEEKYSPIIKNDEFVFPIDFVSTYIKNEIDSIDWHEPTKRLTITNEFNVIRMKSNDSSYLVNNEPLELEMPVYEEEDGIYISKSIIEDIFNVEFIYDEENNYMIVDFLIEEKKTAEISGLYVKLYEDPHSDSSKIHIFKNGDELTIFGEEEEFTKVITDFGLIGYVYTDKISNFKTIPVEESQAFSNKADEIWKPEEGMRVNMAWEQVFSLANSSGDTRKITSKALNVLSPTWFAVSNTDGDITNIAHKSYVDFAHENGYQVWALVSNEFDGIITDAVLSDPDKRDKVIKQILAFVSLYDLDGINIDFESVPSKNGEQYVQFIKELTPYLKNEGVVVSVDMYIPSPWTTHYNMAEVAKVVDYICVMVYDEHYSGSKQSGSVSSLNWARNAIIDTVNLMPSEKVIMGMPLYTRLWEEKIVNGAVVVVSNKAYGIDAIHNIIAENGAEIVYDEESGQNYAEYNVGSSKFRVWLEDETSLQKRFDIVNEFNLAGSAFWKRSLESEFVWDIVYDNQPINMKN